MSLEALKNGKRVIGIKQVTKAVNKGLVGCVFIADDADVRVLQPLRELCGEKKSCYRKCSDDGRSWNGLFDRGRCGCGRSVEVAIIVKNLVIFQRL